MNKIKRDRGGSYISNNETITDFIKNYLMGISERLNPSAKARKPHYCWTNLFGQEIARGKPKGAMTSNAPRILWCERLRRKRRRTNYHFSLA